MTLEIHILAWDRHGMLGAKPANEISFTPS